MPACADSELAAKAMAATIFLIFIPISLPVNVFLFNELLL
jgi:hypothetical protein